MKQATDILGNVSTSVADEIGISREVKVVMGSPDRQCACIGSGAVRDFEGHLYIKIYTATKKIYQKLLQLPESTIGNRSLLTAILTSSDKRRLSSNAVPISVLNGDFASMRVILTWWPSASRTYNYEEPTGVTPARRMAARARIVKQSK